VDAFNYITAHIYCPTCGTAVESFQTKDGTTEPLRYETVPLEAASSLYGQCDRCDTWLDLERRPGTSGTRLSDYTLTWDPHRERQLSRRHFFTRFLRR